MGLTQEEKEAARFLRTTLKLKLAERAARRLLADGEWGGRNSAESAIVQLAQDTQKWLSLMDEAEKD